MKITIYGWSTKPPEPDSIPNLGVARTVLFITDLGLDVRMGQEFRHPRSMMGHLSA